MTELLPDPNDRRFDIFERFVRGRVEERVLTRVRLEKLIDDLDRQELDLPSLESEARAFVAVRITVEVLKEYFKHPDYSKERARDLFRSLIDKLDRIQEERARISGETEPLRGYGTMPAICYSCHYKSKMIPGLGTTADPIATCAICGVLSCDGHGKRDRGVRRFQCVLCVPNLLTVSAAKQSQNRQIREDFPVSEAERQLLVRTIGEFLERWPEFSNLITEERPGQFYAPEPNSGRLWDLWNSVPPEAQQLIKAAILIAEQLEIRPQDLPAILASSTRRRDR